MNRPRIILASGSAVRAAILNGAGVAYEQARPDVDEAAIKRAREEAGAGLEETAMALAEAKALAVKGGPDALVVGADQILEFQGRGYDKAADLAEARARLLELQGDDHTLINAVAVAREGDIVWRHLDRPRLFMRKMDAGEIDAYLAAAGEDILTSVGAYQVEGPGARLLHRIEGDYFAVLGLSLFPLLDCLRAHGALEF